MSDQQYRVIKAIGSGVFAEVFLAANDGIEGFNKPFAVKRILEHFCNKEQYIAMLLDEVRLAANLSHSNVVSIWDIGVGDGVYYIVMEYVDGATLKAIFEHHQKQECTVSVEAAVYMAIEVCKGLSYAHELKNDEGEKLLILHRDIKPSNVLISKHGEVKVMDFGISKALSQLAESDAGALKGKFGYLAPETVLEQGLDQRVDIFAVGIVLWEMLAGRSLFGGETDFQTVMMVRNAAIPSLSMINGMVPPQLEQIIERALAREPARRYGSARELGHDLNRFLYRYGKPVGSDDLAELVRVTAGALPTTTTNSTRRNSESINPLVVEFSSVTRIDVKFPKPLVEAYRSGRLALFIGSGLSLDPSVKGNFPSWSQLPERLLERCEQFDARDEEVIWAKRARFKLRMSLEDMLSELGTLRTALGRDYQAALNDIFRPSDATPSDAHRAIVQLAVRAILTTNYDQLFELLPETPRREPYTWAEADKALGDLRNGRNVLLKVHGTAERHETVVMSEREYHEVRANRSYQAVLSYLLQEHVFLFVGYGMNDPLDLDLALKGNAEAFKASAQRHYVLLKSPPDTDRDRYEREYNVRVIPYSDHAELPGILAKFGALKSVAP